MTNKPEFAPGELFRIRDRLGFGVIEFASWMGVTRQTVSNWETGRSIPTGPALRVFQLLKAKLDA